MMTAVIVALASSTTTNTNTTPLPHLYYCGVNVARYKCYNTVFLLRSGVKQNTSASVSLLSMDVCVCMGYLFVFPIFFPPFAIVAFWGSWRGNLILLISSKRQASKRRSRDLGQEDRDYDLPKARRLKTGFLSRNSFLIWVFKHANYATSTIPFTENC